MQERYLPAQIQVEAAKEPLDIKVVKFSRKLDVFQIVGGAILTPFFPALGVGIMAWSGVTYWGAGKYIENRTNKRQRQFAMAA